MDYVPGDNKKVNTVRRSPNNFSRVSTLPRDFKTQQWRQSGSHSGTSHRNSFSGVVPPHPQAERPYETKALRGLNHGGRSFSESSATVQEPRYMAPGSGMNSNGVSSSHYASSLVSTPSHSDSVPTYQRYPHISRSFSSQSEFLSASEYNPGGGSQLRPSSSQGYRPGECSVHPGSSYGGGMSWSAPESGIGTPGPSVSADISTKHVPPVKSNQEFVTEFEAALNAFKAMGDPSIRNTAAAVAAQGIPLRSQTVDQRGGQVADSNTLKVWSTRPMRSNSVQSASSTNGGAGKRRRSWVNFVRGKRDSSVSSEDYASWSTLRKAQSELDPTQFDADANMERRSVPQEEVDYEPTTPSATATEPVEHHYSQPVELPRKEGPVWKQDCEELNWRGCTLSLDGRKLHCTSTDGKEPVINDTFAMSELHEVRSATWLSSEPSEFEGDYFEVVAESTQCMFAVPGSDDTAESWIEVIDAALKLHRETLSRGLSSARQPNMMVSTSGESGYFSQETTSPLLKRRTEAESSKAGPVQPEPVLAESKVVTPGHEEIPPPKPVEEVSVENEPAGEDDIPLYDTPSLSETPDKTDAEEKEMAGDPLYDIPSLSATPENIDAEEKEMASGEHLPLEPSRSSLTLPLEFESLSPSCQAVGRTMSIPASRLSATNDLPPTTPLSTYSKPRSKSDAGTLSRVKPLHPKRPPPVPPKPKDDSKKKRWPTLRLQRKDKDPKESLTSTGRVESLDDFNAQGPAIRRYNRIVPEGTSPIVPAAPSAPFGSPANVSAMSPGDSDPRPMNGRSPFSHPMSRSFSSSVDSRHTPSPEDSLTPQLTPGYHIVTNGPGSIPPSEMLPEVAAQDLQTDDNVLLQNYLWKQEPSSLLWNKWWVVLSKKSGITMYKTHAKLAKSDSEVPLHTVSKINRILDSDGCIQEQRFEVVAADKTAHLFSTPTGAECQRWISTLRDAVFASHGTRAHRLPSQRQDSTTGEWSPHSSTSSANLQQLKAALGAAIEAARESSGHSQQTSRAQTPIHPHISSKMSSPGARPQQSSDPRSPNGKERTMPTVSQLTLTPRRPVKRDYFNYNSKSLPHPLTGLNRSNDLWKEHSPTAHSQSSKFKPYLIPTYQVETAEHGMETMV